MSTSKKIEFDLFSNAKDSLWRAIELLVQGPVYDGRPDQSRLKHAIVSAAHVVELLLKERLRKTHPAFVWEQVDKYPSLSARTVTVDGAVARLGNLCDVHISERDRANISSLRKTRNAIEHYEWLSNEKEARIIVGNALSFAFAFSKEELGLDLSSELRSDETWRFLIEDLREFARAHSARIEERLKREEKYSITCESCETESVSALGGACELCGHWNDV